MWKKTSKLLKLKTLLAKMVVEKAVENMYKT